jgi:asparagine synthase (glutamine-hydrolysing)
MSDLLKQTYDTIEESVSSCTAECISLSGGLDSTIIAYFMQPRKPSAIAVISENFVANDLTYCQLAAQRFDLALFIKMYQIEDVYSAIENTIRILGNFNDIEIRNNSVMYMAINEAKNRGFNKIVTGDGADEVFAGYNFLINKEPEELKSELDRLEQIMHFPSHAIGRSLGVTVESPFCSKNVIEFARKIPAEQLINVHDGKKFGKWILRAAFEEKIPKAIAWRQKSPMQDGAGTCGLTDFFDRLIPDNIFYDKVQKIKSADGVTIRTKESLQYYEIFVRHHKIPRSDESSKVCSDCKYAIDSKSRFCRMCGRFPV